MTAHELLISFLRASKPEACKTTEVVVVCQLILLNGSACDPKALAPLCGLTDDKAIIRTLKGLVLAQWVTRFKAPTGEIVYIVNADKLPRAEKGATHDEPTA